MAIWRAAVIEFIPKTFKYQPGIKTLIFNTIKLNVATRNFLTFGYVTAYLQF